MMTDIALRQLAILVDAENVSPALAPRILSEAAKHGSVELRLAFGAVASAGWDKALVRYAFHRAARTPQAGGRNAADIELAIAAMDLLHDTRIEGFCLVSSDSDFAPLAIRLRQSGRHVVGMGERKTPRAFVEACDEFVILDGASSGTMPVPALCTKIGRRDEFIALLVTAMAPLDKDDGWVDIGVVGVSLRKVEPGFAPSKFGKKKLKSLLQSCGPQVEIFTTAHSCLVRVRTQEE